MKAKTKIIITLSLAGVIMLSAITALILVIAAFNATTGSGLKVSYVAKNVEAEVTMGYVVSEENSSNPKELEYTTVKSGNKEKLVFSSANKAETISASFDNLPEIELEKDAYVYLRYTFKHTGTTTNSGNYLNVVLNNTFSAINNIKIDYALYDREMNESYINWMAGIDGLTVTRDTDNECVLFVRLYIDTKTQNALIEGSFTWSMTTSDTEYYANMMALRSGFYDSTKVLFKQTTPELLQEVSGKQPTLLSADGSGPINKYVLNDGTCYVLSDTKIIATDCGHMFGECESVNEINFEWLDTRYVTNMSNMFTYCYPQNVDFSQLNTSNVTDMSGMFQAAAYMENIDVSSFDTSNVTNMAGMFENCVYARSINVSGFNTSKVTNMMNMFNNCYDYLTELDLSSFDTSNVTNMVCMFAYCANVETIYVSDLFVTTAITVWEEAGIPGDTQMFDGCASLVGGNGTASDGAYGTDSTYARIDAPGTPGYFTRKTA